MVGLGVNVWDQMKIGVSGVHWRLNGVQRGLEGSKGVENGALRNYIMHYEAIVLSTMRSSL